MSCNCDCGSAKQDCGCGSSDCAYGCDCGGHGGFVRQFATKEEQINELACYLDDLKKEVQAVEERIADLKK